MDAIQEPPTTHMGDPDGVPGFWLWLNPSLADIWEVNQQVDEALSFLPSSHFFPSPLFCHFKQINKLFFLLKFGLPQLISLLNFSVISFVWPPWGWHRYL